jgi:hypothetical protein
LPALAELDNLYSIRSRHSTADQAKLAAVEQESAEVLLRCAEGLAAADQKVGNWNAALKQYEQALARAQKVTSLASAQPVNKLRAGATLCHERLLGVEIQPHMNRAAGLLAQKQYDEAEGHFNTAITILRGPFAPLKEQAAAKLRLTVTTQLTDLKQARLVAEAMRLVVLAQQTADATTKQTVKEQTAALAHLAQASSLLQQAGVVKAKLPDAAAPLRNQISLLNGRLTRRRGEGYEAQQQWPQARQDYEAAQAIYQQRGETATVATLQLRQSIIALKSGVGEVVTDAAVISQAEKPVRLDLAYRAALGYLRAGEVQTAELFIPHLTGQIPEAAALAAAASQLRLNALASEVEGTIATAQNDQATFPQLQEVYSAIPNLVQRTAAVDAQLGRQVAALEPYVLSRLLSAGLAQNQLLPLLDILTKQPGFLASPETLKNIGIICLRIIVSGSLNGANYQRVLGLWLTALHSNNVLLASLESTSWDDELTFTLEDSLGVRSLSDLPANVNHEVADDHNISLGETQRELMRVVESALNEIESPQLQMQVAEFYSAQKNALVNLITEIDEIGGASAQSVAVAAPFVAINYGLNRAIVHFLTSQYKQQQKETLLKCALPYHGNLANPQIATYQEALALEKQAQECFAVPRIANLRKLPELLKKSASLLNEYPRLRTRLVSQLVDSVREANEEEEEGKLVATFQALVDAFPTTEAFKVLGANHICDWCIEALNEEQMTATIALGHLLRAWTWRPDDERAAANMVIVFGLVCKAATSSSTEHKQELDILEKVHRQVSANQNYTIRQTIAEHLEPMQRKFHDLLSSSKINPASLMMAAEMDLPGMFTPSGLMMGKKLLLMRNLAKLALGQRATTV